MQMASPGDARLQIPPTHGHWELAPDRIKIDRKPDNSLWALGSGRGMLFILSLTQLCLSDADLFHRAHRLYTHLMAAFNLYAVHDMQKT